MFENKELKEQIKQKNNQISELERDAVIMREKSQKTNSEVKIFALHQIFVKFYFKNEELRNQNLKLEARNRNRAEESQKMKTEVITELFHFQATRGRSSLNREKILPN